MKKLCFILFFAFQYIACIKLIKTFQAKMTHVALHRSLRNHLPIQLEIKYSYLLCFDLIHCMKMFVYFYVLYLHKPIISHVCVYVWVFSSCFFILFVKCIASMCIFIFTIVIHVSVCVCFSRF